MSGQATGWVLEQGPHPDMVDRFGKPYGARARGWRAVLITIADAANREGLFAHPGLKAMMSGALYSRRQVFNIEDELVAEGWVIITEVGGGRGHATVYMIPGVLGAERQTVPPLHPLAESETVSSEVHPSEESNGALSIEKRCTGEAERVQPESETVHSGVHPNGLPTDDPTENNLAADAARPTERDPVKAQAHRLAILAFEQPVVPTLRSDGAPFPAVMALIERALRAGRSVNAIEAAITAGVDVWTANGLNTAIGMVRGRPSAREKRIADRGLGAAFLEATGLTEQRAIGDGRG